MHYEIAWETRARMERRCYELKQDTVGTVVCTGGTQALVPGLWDLRTSAEGEHYVGAAMPGVRMFFLQ